MAELRHVVTMFIGIGGIDFVNDDDSGAALDAYVSWAQNVIAQYESRFGTLDVAPPGAS